MHSHIKKRLVDKIDWYTCASVDGALDKTFLAKRTLKGYCVAKTRVVRTRTGSEVISNTTIYLSGSETISYKDECKTPYGERSPVLQITPYKTPKGGLLEVLI